MLLLDNRKEAFFKTFFTTKLFIFTFIFITEKLPLFTNLKCSNIKKKYH